MPPVTAQTFLSDPEPTDGPIMEVWTRLPSRRRFDMAVASPVCIDTQKHPDDAMELHELVRQLRITAVSCDDPSPTHTSPLIFTKNLISKSPSSSSSADAHSDPTVDVIHLRPHDKARVFTHFFVSKRHSVSKGAGDSPVWDVLSHMPWELRQELQGRVDGFSVVEKRLVPGRAEMAAAIKHERGERLVIGNYYSAEGPKQFVASAAVALYHGLEHICGDPDLYFCGAWELLLDYLRTGTYHSRAPESRHVAPLCTYGKGADAQQRALYFAKEIINHNYSRTRAVLALVYDFAKFLCHAAHWASVEGEPIASHDVMSCVGPASWAFVHATDVFNGLDALSNTRIFQNPAWMHPSGISLIRTRSMTLPAAATAFMYSMNDAASKWVFENAAKPDGGGLKALVFHGVPVSSLAWTLRATGIQFLLDADPKDTRVAIGSVHHDKAGNVCSLLVTDHFIADYFLVACSILAPKGQTPLPVAVNAARLFSVQEGLLVRPVCALLSHVWRSDSFATHSASLIVHPETKEWTGTAGNTDEEIPEELQIFIFMCMERYVETEWLWVAAACLLAPDKPLPLRAECIREMGDVPSAKDFFGAAAGERNTEWCDEQYWTFFQKREPLDNSFRSTTFAPFASGIADAPLFISTTDNISSYASPIDNQEGEDGWTCARIANALLGLERFVHSRSDAKWHVTPEQIMAGGECPFALEGTELCIPSQRTPMCFHDPGLPNTFSPDMQYALERVMTSGSAPETPADFAPWRLAHTPPARPAKSVYAEPEMLPVTHTSRKRFRPAPRLPVHVDVQRMVSKTSGQKLQQDTHEEHPRNAGAPQPHTCESPAYSPTTPAQPFGDQTPRLVQQDQFQTPYSPTMPAQDNAHAVGYEPCSDVPYSKESPPYPTAQKTNNNVFHDIANGYNHPGDELCQDAGGLHGVHHTLYRRR